MSEYNSKEEIEPNFDPACSGFSCPFERFDDAFAELVAAEYAKEVMQLFIHRFEDILCRNGPEVNELLSGLVKTRLCFDIAWSAEIGNLHSAIMLNDPARALREATALALLVMTEGLPAKWEINLSKPSTFLWDDWSLPFCDYLAVTSTGDQAAITSSLEGDSKHFSFKFSQDYQGWDNVAPDYVTRLPELRVGEGCITLLPKRVAQDIGFLDGSKTVFESYSANLRGALLGSLELLREHVAPYYTWVTRMTCRLAVKDSPPDVLKSGSYGKCYRTVFISNNTHPLALAEMLVHEASHQYYDFIRLLGHTVHPQHTQLYFSPIAGYLQPLEKLLSAYHAFANVSLFYRISQEKRLGLNESLAGFQPILSETLRHLSRPLCGGDALTPIGRALIEPLMRAGVGG
jgi:HEXXH motif-containing protein